jgi:hypothetical protein
MFSFLSAGKAKVDLGGVEHPGDLEVLKQLVKKGDGLVQPRHSRFYFYKRKGDMRLVCERFDQLASEASEVGFRVSEKREDALVLEVEQSMDVNVVNAARRLLDDLAERYEVEFDGWECQLVKAA